ncbi:odorant receptor 13a-like [Hylaeus anthracinus]|uniref:odorant receptor 13a-like n=1 Tax=Hylaeus anthracinus TaxID=313031 RepID=UPI0023B8978A|nr:odorant receptor 13a-like [Hylaeus anthracinus]
MQLLRWIFTYLAVGGCSRPASWTSTTKKFLYNVYTIVLLLMIHALLVTQILDIVFNVENQDEFSDNFYLTLGIFVACCKMYNLLTSHKSYVILIDSLQEEPLKPVNSDEVEIQMKFENWAKRNIIAYTIAMESCLVFMYASTITKDFKAKRLPYRAWIPYDYSSLFLFSITYIHQALSMTICTILDIACDNLFSGLLIHIYCVFEILGYRLRNIKKYGKDSAKQCARLHNHIYKFATKVNGVYKMIMLVQFLATIATMCLEIYQLTQKEVDTKYAVMVTYTSSALMQILYYCWYGNEVRLKSLAISDMVMECNLECLDSDAKKILLMMMKRATMPIEFTSIYAVEMNLASFMGLLKTSYSAYNLLNQN